MGTYLEIALFVSLFPVTIHLTQLDTEVLREDTESKQRHVNAREVSDDTERNKRTEPHIQRTRQSSAIITRAVHGIAPTDKTVYKIKWHNRRTKTTNSGTAMIGELPTATGRIKTEEMITRDRVLHRRRIITLMLTKT